MKLTLLILSLLLTFLMNVGCANLTPQDQQFWLGLTKVSDYNSASYGQDSVNCISQALPNGQTRTVCR